jgi:flavin reductase (DIM6/NTAB) family NADH-FMN oxidoreductase RutF
LGQLSTLREGEDGAVAEEQPMVDIAQFKRALGLWASGVTVVSTRIDGLVYCMTASSFSSLSIDPLMVLVCVAHDARLHGLLMESSSFAVNILRDDQRHLADAYSRSGREPQEKLDLVETFDGPSGSPIFKRCLAYIDCTMGSVYDGGDHSIVLGKVQAAGSDESGMPLLYFNRNYRAVHDIDG